MLGSWQGGTWHTPSSRPRCWGHYNFITLKDILDTQAAMQNNIKMYKFLRWKSNNLSLIFILHRNGEQGNTRHCAQEFHISLQNSSSVQLPNPRYIEIKMKLPKHKFLHWKARRNLTYHCKRTLQFSYLTPNISKSRSNCRYTTFCKSSKKCHISLQNNTSVT